MSGVGRELLTALAQILGEDNLSIASAQAASGGCISQAVHVELSDGRRFFVKRNHNADTLFEAEAQGLAKLALKSPLRTPSVIGLARSIDNPTRTESFLVLEHIPCGQPDSGSWNQLGSLLAEQHRATADAFGYDDDNFIGATAQPNAWCSSWPEFFRKERLQFQVELAESRGLVSGPLVRLANQLCENIELFLTTDEAPALLHGDLWNGNVLFDSDRQPVIIDPATYYGHREAELALPALFGGFPSQFWDSYQRAWPLPSGWQKRLEIYKLYHLLNHLNLFGGSYSDQCIHTLREILRS